VRYCKQIHAEKSYLGKDNLPAISGLGSSLALPRFGKFLARARRNTSSRPLMACFLPSENRPTTLCQAPTWSWASVNGNVYFSSYFEACGPVVKIQSAELVEVGCDLATGGTFGRVENGSSLPFAALYAVAYVKVDTPFRDGNAIVSCKDLGFVSTFYADGPGVEIGTLL
jgi:hypothetical protein